MYNTTQAEFQHDVLDRPDESVVVMFHASWCGPCKTMKPLIERLAGEQGFALVGVDAGENRALAAEYGVRSVPAVLVFKNGDVTCTPLWGGHAEERLRSYLAAAGVPA